MLADETGGSCIVFNKPWVHLKKMVGVKFIKGSFRLGGLFDTQDGIRVEIIDSNRDKPGIKIGYETVTPFYVNKRDCEMLAEFFKELGETL